MNQCLTLSYVASTIVILGCGTGDVTQSAPDGPSITVSYQADPLPDVEVSLHATPTGPAIAKAISATDGKAHFASVPSPEPTAYFVSLHSHGDGGWMLDAKFSAAKGSGFQLKPLLENQQQHIELPRGAVRPLTPRRKR